MARPVQVIPTSGDSPLGQLVQEMAALRPSYDRYEELKARVTALVEQVADVDTTNVDLHAPGVDRALRVYAGTSTNLDGKRLRAERPDVYREYVRSTPYHTNKWVNR